jgi:hypothetical protein
MPIAYIFLVIPPLVSNESISATPDSSLKPLQPTCITLSILTPFCIISPKIPPTITPRKIPGKAGTFNAMAPITITIGSKRTGEITKFAWSPFIMISAPSKFAAPT